MAGKDAKAGMTPTKWVLTAIGLFLQFGHSLFPNIAGLNDMGMGVLCIFVGTMIMMLFVDVTWPVIACILAFSMTGVFTYNQVIQMAFGNNVVWFIAFAGMIFSAMQRTGLLRRVAIWMISRPFAKRSPWLFVLAVWGSAFLLGLVIDVVALIMLFTTLLIEIFEEIGVQKGDRFAKLMIMGTLSVVGLSYGCTPIGHIISMMALSYFADYGLTFGAYTLYGTLIGIVAFLLIFVAYRFILRMDVTPIAAYDPTTLQDKIKDAWTKREIWVGIAYLFIVLLWLVPSMLTNALPEVATYFDGLTNCMPLALGVLIMCLLHIEGKPLMNFALEIKEGAPWRAVIVVALCMLLGSTISNADAGISTWLYGLLEPIMAAVPAFVFVVLVCIFTNVLTNFASDMVTLLLISSITLSLLSGGNIAVSGAAMGVVIGMLACTAYMTPPASSYAAYVSGTGWVDFKSQLAYGFTSLLATTIAVGCVGYPLMVAVL